MYKTRDSEPCVGPRGWQAEMCTVLLRVGADVAVIGRQSGTPSRLCWCVRHGIEKKKSQWKSQEVSPPAPARSILHVSILKGRGTLGDGCGC